MSEWASVTLGEIAAREGSSIAIGPFGSRMKAHNYVESGVKVIRGQNITDDGRLTGDYVLVSEEFAASLGASRLAAGDIVLPHRGAIGRAALVPEGDFVMSTSLMRIRIDRYQAVPEFVAAFLCSNDGRREILKFASTVGTPGIGQPLSSLRQIVVPLPPLAEQRRIASVLGALDELIDTNRRVVGSLEEMLAARFSGAGFDTPSKDGTRLGDLIEVNPRVPKPTSSAPYIDMAALPTSRARVQSVAYRQPSGGARFQNGDTVMARITPCLENGKTAYIDVLEPNEIGVGSTEFIVLRSARPLGSHWSYFLARSPRFRDYAVRHMSGTSGRQRCSAEVIERYSIAVPDEREAIRFAVTAAEMFTALKQLDEEAAQAARIRDELLPLLLSGRLRVDEVVA